MRLDPKRDALLIIPETEADRAYIEDTLGLKTSEAKITLQRIPDVVLGFKKDDTYVLKTVTS